MDAKSKKLMFGLIVLIMLLSIIPLAFLGSGNQIDVPDIEDENLVLTGTGNFNGKITSSPARLSFVGLSQSSDDSRVRELINSIGYFDCTKNNENCSVKVGLNPYGIGYRYEVILKLKNSTDASYVGYRLSYRLNSVLDTSSSLLSKYAIMPVLISLQGMDEIEGIQVTAKNISSVAYVSYVNLVNGTVKLECKEVTYSKQGILMSAPSCIDITDYPNDLGLDAATLLNNYNSVNKSIEIDLAFSEVYFEAEGNFTNSLIAEELDFAQVDISEDNSTIQIWFTNSSKINDIQKALENYEIVESYKEAVVHLPDSVELEKEYSIMRGIVSLKFPVSQSSGKQMVKLQFSTIFDEVFHVEIA